MNWDAILQAFISAFLGAFGALGVQWYRARQESPKLKAEARKSNAEADKTAAETWKALYDEVCERLATLEQKCTGLQALVADVEFLKRDNRRLRTKLNQVIAWYSNLYHQAVAAGVEPEFEPPEPEDLAC